ncbi:MAG: DNA polymerase III subunit beta [Oscillospiraceae bacterium]|nr:DNA polymerase III subunit beta [Oscillospiraceae bacterium]
MKFKCNKGMLAEAVASAQKAVSLKSTLPILEGLLLTVGDGLTLTGNDLEIAIQCEIPVQVIERGSVVMNCRLFSEMVRKLPDDIVTMSLSEENVIKVECGNARFEVKGLPAAGYPELPSVGRSNALRIGQATLREMIRRTRFAISVNDNRPILTGALFAKEDGEFTVVAIDGIRLALRKEILKAGCGDEAGDRAGDGQGSGEGPGAGDGGGIVGPDLDGGPDVTVIGADGEELARADGDFSLVIPGKSLNELEKLLTGDDEVTLYSSKNQALFDMGGCKVITRLLQGEYLKYRSMVTRESQTSIRFKVMDLLGVIDRISLIAMDDKFVPICLDIKDDAIHVTSQTVQGSAAEEIAVEMRGNPLKVSYYPRYVMEVLRNIGDDEVTMNFNSNMGPSCIFPLEGDAYAYVVMPCSTRS